MSKMFSPSSFGSRTRSLLGIVCVTATAFAACGRVDVHSSSVRGTAYVNVGEVVKKHPLYPQLAQLDDAIAAINLEAAAPRVPLSAAQIATETKELNKELRDAQDRANKI